MKQMIAGCMRINGAGACRAVFDGMVRQEMEAQAAVHRRDMESAEIMRRVAARGRADERRRHLNTLRSFTNRERLAERFADRWAQIYGMLLELLRLCEEWGLVEKEGAEC